MSAIKCVLFDIDGTLIDSNDPHAKAWQDVFRENGFEISYDEIRSRIGMGGDHLLPELTGISKDDVEGQKLEQRRGEIFRDKYLPTLRAFDHARQLIETLKAKDFKTVVATSASSKDLKLLLHQADLENLFDARTNSSEVENSKPDPDIIQAALGEAKVDARQAVMVGDTPYDIEAAASAGVKTIALTCGGWSRESLSLAGAWKVFDDPAALLQAVKTNHAFI